MPRRQNTPKPGGKKGKKVWKQKQNSQAKKWAKHKTRVLVDVQPKEMIPRSRAVALGSGVAQANVAASAVIKASMKNSRMESKILSCIMLPYESEIPRVLTGAQHQVVMPVAAAKNFRVFTLDFSSYSVTGFADRVPLVNTTGTFRPVWEATDTTFTIIQFHDSVLQAIYPTMHKDAGACTYSSEMLINSQCALTQNTLSFMPNELGATFLNDLHIQPACLVSSSGPAKYGPVIECWQFDQKRRAFWVDAANNPVGEAQVYLSIKAGAHTIVDDFAINIGLCKWVNFLDPQPSAELLMPGILAGQEDFVTFSVRESGYYYFKIWGTAKSTDLAAPYLNPIELSIDIGYTNNTWVVSQHMCNDNLSLDSFGAKRSCDVKRAQTVGTSMLISNTTAAAFKSGQVVGRVLQNEDLWFEYAGQETRDLTEVAAQLVYTGRWENGVYSVTFPNQLRYSDVARFERNRTYNLSNPLTTTDLNFNGFVGANIVRIDIGKANPTAGALSAKVVLCTSYTFVTDSQMFRLALPDCSPDQWEKASFKLGSLQRFHDNPWHWGDISNAIKKAAGWVVDTGRKVAGFVPTAQKLVGMGLDAAELVASTL